MLDYMSLDETMFYYKKLKTYFLTFYLLCWGTGRHLYSGNLVHFCQILIWELVREELGPIPSTNFLRPIPSSALHSHFSIQENCTHQFGSVNPPRMAAAKHTSGSTTMPIIITLLHPLLPTRSYTTLHWLGLMHIFYLYAVNPYDPLKSC